MATNVDRIHRGASDSAPIKINPSQAHKAFKKAVDGLPASGGFELYVTAGSAPYRFGREVLVDRPGVTLRFSPGAQLIFQDPGSASNLFRITASGFTCHGARVEHRLRPSTDDSLPRSVFRVEDPSPTQSADDARFVDCVFDLSQETPDALAFTCIRAVGASSAEPRRGLTVRDCTFTVNELGVKQTVSWLGEDPYGICAIRAVNSRECVLTRNQFRGVLTQITPVGNFAASRTGPMIYLQNAPSSVVSESVFSVLDLVPASAGAQAASVILVARHDGEPGHHTVLTDNTFESIGARHMIELRGARADVVSNSNFGRVFECEGALGVDATAEGLHGDTLVVAGNNFHNVHPVAQVRLAGISDTTIADNVFNLVKPAHVPLAVDPDSCTNLHLAASQVRTSPVS